jgi:hypothetical protein
MEFRRVLFRSANQSNLIFFLVDRLDDVFGRLKGNFMFGGLPAEKYSDPKLPLHVIKIPRDLGICARV